MSSLGVEYRLSKKRMESIQEKATHLRFTCEFEKHHDVKASDYVQIALNSQSPKIDILTLNKKNLLHFCASG